MTQLGRATFRKVSLASLHSASAPTVRGLCSISYRTTLRPKSLQSCNSPTELPRGIRGRDFTSTIPFLSGKTEQVNNHPASIDGQRIYSSAFRCRPLPPPTSIFHYHFPPAAEVENTKRIKGDSYTPPNFSGDLPAYIDGITGEGLSRDQVRKTSLRLGYALTHTPTENTLPPAQTGDVIFILSPNSLHYPLIFFACQSALLVPTLCNSSATSRDVAYQLKDSGAKIGFVHPDLVGVWQGAIDILRKEGEAEGQYTDGVPMFVMASTEEVAESDKAVGTEERHSSYESLFVPESTRNRIDDTASRAWAASMESWDGLQVRESVSEYAISKTDVSYDDTAVICYSSGTTGLPKGTSRTGWRIGMF